MRTLNLKVIRSLLALKVQTAGIALLIACGSGLLIAAWSSYDALRGAKEKTYRNLRFGQIFADVKSAPLSLNSRLRSIPGVAEIDLRMVEDGLIHFSGAPSGRFISLPESGTTGLDRLHLSLGDFPVASSIPEAVVHEGFAQAHGLRPGDRIETTLGGRRWTFRISGIGLSPDTVYAIGPGAPLPDDLRFGVFWMRRTDLERMTGKKHTFRRLSLTLNEDARSDRIREEVDRLISPYGTAGTYLRKYQVSDRLIENEIAEQKTLAILFPGVFLSIAAFQTQSALVRLIGLERLQIATLRALGYGHTDIVLHYLKLVFLMVSGGSLLGVLLGTGVGKLMAGSYRLFFRFPEVAYTTGKDAVLLGLGASVFPAFLGATTALKSIRTLTPAEALRPTPPPTFRITLLERKLFGDRLRMRSRMILRNLFARPLRLTWNTLGMACAWILLILSLSWMDILANLIDERFHRLSRETLSMSLITPVHESEVRSWSTLPGVIQWETQRTLPVRMRFQHHQRTLLLTGASTTTELERYTLTHTNVSLDGLILSRYFKENWGLRPGDPVEFEPLAEGSAPFTLPVFGFVQDSLGLAARVPKSVLHKKLDESPSFNRILLRIDPLSENEILSAIQLSPSGTGVQSKKQILAGFQRTLGTLIRVSTFILVSFAWVMTLSLLVNSLRISTSERQREIATLRVLGLDFDKAFGLLLSETGVQWLLAIPIGILSGNWITRAALNAMHAEEYDFTVVLSRRTYGLAFLVIGGSFLIGALRMRSLSKRSALPEALKSED